MGVELIQQTLLRAGPASPVCVWRTRNVRAFQIHNDKVLPSLVLVVRFKARYSTPLRVLQLVEYQFAGIKRACPWGLKSEKALETGQLWVEPGHIIHRNTYMRLQQARRRDDERAVRHGVTTRQPHRVSLK
jgi:hypothetical protein